MSNLFSLLKQCQMTDGKIINHSLGSFKSVKVNLKRPQTVKLLEVAHTLQLMLTEKHRKMLQNYLLRKENPQVHVGPAEVYLTSRKRLCDC